MNEELNEKEKEKGRKKKKKRKKEETKKKKRRKEEKKKRRKKKEKRKENQNDRKSAKAYILYARISIYDLLSSAVYEYNNESRTGSNIYSVRHISDHRIFMHVFITFVFQWI